MASTTSNPRSVERVAYADEVARFLEVSRAYLALQSPLDETSVLHFCCNVKPGAWPSPIFYRFEQPFPSGGQYVVR